jgi:DNA-binding XRE family transcriptional regulator
MSALQELEKLADQMPQPAIRHSILMTAHVLRYPMADILAKVPGSTLKDRAKAIGVSRQTMYVWAHEKFRPGLDQAVIISKLTGVPVWKIRDLQVDDGDDAGATGAKTGGRMGEDGAVLSSLKRRTSAAHKTRARIKSRLGGSARKMRKRVE